MTRSRASCQGRTFTSATLWQVVKPLVRQVQNENAVLVVDDIIAHKPHTDASELIGWHYDHTTGTSVKGINFLTTLYCTDDGSLPVAFALVEKAKEFTDKKDLLSRSRNALHAVGTLSLEHGKARQVWLEQVLSRFCWSSRSLRTKTKAGASCIWSRATGRWTATRSWASTKNGGRSKSTTSP